MSSLFSVYSRINAAPWPPPHTPPFSSPTGSHYNVEQEVVEMQLEWEEAVRNRESVKALVKPQHLRPLYITVCLMVLTQITGLLPVISNLSIIFKVS